MAMFNSYVKFTRGLVIDCEDLVIFGGTFLMILWLILPALMVFLKGLWWCAIPMVVVLVFSMAFNPGDHETALDAWWLHEPYIALHDVPGRSRAAARLISSLMKMGVDWKKRLPLWTQWMIIRVPDWKLVGGWYTWYTYPSEKWWSSSVGMMTFPIWWESHKSHVPNHQPESDWKWPFMAQIAFRNTYDVCSSKKRHSFYPDPWLRIIAAEMSPLS